jgi:hypothetical protein
MFKSYGVAESIIRERLRLWDQLQKDFSSLNDNEEILITLNGRQYVVRPANEEDIDGFKGYDKDGNFTPESE